MEYIIIVKTDKKTFALSNDDHSVAIFYHGKDAKKCADQHPTCQAYQYIILNLSNLFEVGQKNIDRLDTIAAGAVWSERTNDIFMNCYYNIKKELNNEVVP